MDFMDRRYPSRMDVRGYLGDALTGSKVSKNEYVSWEEALTAYRSSNNTFRWQSLVPMGNMLPERSFIRCPYLAI